MAGGDVHPGRFTADRHAVHRMIGRLHWRRRFGVYPMALHRGGTALDMRLSMMRLAVGDTLLLDGTPDRQTRSA